MFCQRIGPEYIDLRNLFNVLLLFSSAWAVAYLIILREIHYVLYVIVYIVKLF